MIRYILVIMMFVLFQISVYSQTEEVNECLRLVSVDKVDEAKIRLPELLAKYPDNAAVKFLHAVVLEDGELAINIYKDIIAKFPKSEWTEESYLRIIQYYSIIADTSGAKKYLDEFRKNIPESKLLAVASNAVHVAINQQQKNTDEIVMTEVITDDVEPPKPKIEKKSGKEAEAVKVLIPSGRFSLQVGIYSTQTAAKNEAAKYTKLRMVADIMPKKIGNETMYAVIIGDYKDRKTAESAKPLVAKHCNCIPLIIEK